MKKKNLFRIRNNYQAVIFGVIIGIFTLIAILSLLAVILVKIDIPSENVKYLLFVPAVVSGLISGSVSGKHVKTKGFLWGSISGLSVGIITLAVLLIYNMFSVSVITYLLVPVFALTGSVGGIVSANLKLQ